MPGTTGAGGAGSGGARGCVGAALGVPLLLAGALLPSALGAHTVATLSGVALALGLCLLIARHPRLRDARAATVIGATILSVIASLLVITLAVLVARGTRHRSADASAAIGDTRLLIEAEKAYAANNRGLYDLPECLAAPARCLPGFPADSPMTFLPPLLAPSPLEKQGYRRVFHPGPAVDPAQLQGASPTSIRGFAYVSEPMRQGTGHDRAYCGDETGRVCEWEAGTTVSIIGGRCPATCQALR